MATPVYDRAKFFGTVINEEGIELTDFINFSFNSFIEFLRTRRVKVRRLSSAEEGSPELVSFQEYGDEQFWWVIMLANRLQDPINEFVPGLEIVIPRLQDVEEFRQAQSSGATRGEAVVLN